MKASEAEWLAGAIAREPAALARLVTSLTPIVQARVARSLMKRHRAGRDPRQEVEDFTQEVFLALFDNDARALRAWSPERGLSLRNFVGMFAEHQVSSIFRSGKRRPWNEELFAEADGDPTQTATAMADGPEPRVASQQLFALLIEQLKEKLTPKGYQLFVALIVEQREVAEVQEQLKMSADAVYAWRSRLLKMTREMVQALSNEPEMSEAAPGRRTPNDQSDRHG